MSDAGPFDIAVTGEIGQLRHVLVHRPGDEIVKMTHRELDDLLFDDILAPAETLREHGLLTEILASSGAVVHELATLLEDALAQAPDDARLELIHSACELAGALDLVTMLGSWPHVRLARALIAGVDWAELDATPTTLRRLRHALDGTTRALAPVPNLMFMRDPCIVVGDRVIVGCMATLARAREPLLVSFALTHSGLAPAPPLAFLPSGALGSSPHKKLEGGDVLILSPRQIFIGCSQRTSAQTIERLAKDALFPHFPELERVYAVMMPEARTVMHLDTILTQLDERLFLGYAPLATNAAALPLAVLERGKDAVALPSASVMDILRAELGHDTGLVPCGGTEPLHQEREQWTDGANAVALAPGHVMLYARNVHTIAALAEHGFEEFAVHMVEPPERRAELVTAAMRARRAVISFPSGELSRARGGGRCLTMPLARARV
ncbi:MAG: hypothetical protein EXR75_13490 [Myxococcales bacterium]|nr:hypothetical protein [Myxococcales bacterium]